MKRQITITALLITAILALAGALFAQERRCVKKDGEDFWTELSFEYYEYDAKGNKIHAKNTDGDEKWFDAAGNEIHTKNSDGEETWSEYDAKGNRIHYRRSDGFENWRKFDERGNQIYFKNTDGLEITTVYEYDANENITHAKDSDGADYEPNEKTDTIINRKS